MRHLILFTIMIAAFNATATAASFVPVDLSNMAAGIDYPTDGTPGMKRNYFVIVLFGGQRVLAQ